MLVARSASIFAASSLLPLLDAAAEGASLLLSGIAGGVDFF